MVRYYPLILTLLSGCTSTALQQDGATLADRHVFSELDDVIDAAGVRDAAAARISAFPYLRVNRLLASFTDEVDEPERFSAWVEQMAALDDEARTIELANLPDDTFEHFVQQGGSRTDLLDQIKRHRQNLISSELSKPGNRDLLRKQARVPDDYVTAWRVFGLYPLTSLFVRSRIDRFQQEVHTTFATPLERLPRSGVMQSWQPIVPSRLNTTEVATILRASSANPLAIPLPNAAQRELLFDTFAPQWLIDTVDNNDRPGRLYLTAEGPRVDTSVPLVYRRISHVRHHGAPVLQLSYIIWFPSRPPQRSPDIYAGHLDGITFRVTLGSDGRPLLFDTIHNCGCYHKLFPVDPLTPRPEALSSKDEPPLVPQTLTHTNGVPTLHISSGEHYVQRLSFMPQPEGTTYQWEAYRHLRSLPLPDGGYKSLFDQRGLIRSSHRSERFLLWPMGIRSPGAMRQAGHHAVAFVGRRHFDDPDLIDSLFHIEDPASP